MASKWLRVNCLAASTGAFWLAAFAPVPPIGKGIFYSLSMVAGVQLIQESQRLMVDDARHAALSAMSQELEQVEIALHQWQQEESLKEIYGATTTYPPEVKEELTKSLEHLYREPSAERNEQLTTSTSHEKAYYLAVKSLLEIKGETFVIEQILKLGGRNWSDGKQRLQQILDEGERNGW